MNQVTYKINGQDVASTKQQRREMLASEVGKIINAGGLIGKDSESVFKVVNYFSGGMYCRELHMPEGSEIVGKIHKTRHLNTLVKGECLVITTEREKHLIAPCTFESVEGEQKCILALTDVIWQTYHATEKTDVDEIEQDLISDNFDFLEGNEGAYNELD